MLASDLTEPFFTWLESFRPEKEPLSARARAYLGSVLILREYPKGHLLLHEDQVPSWCWFILSGSARSYYFDYHSQQQHTSWFWMPQQLVFSPRGFFRQRTAGEYIQLLEDSRLLALTAYDRQNLVEHFPEYRLMEACMAEDFHQRFSDHSRLLQLGSRERYLRFCQSHKGLFSIANLSYIASFLQLHPNTLSRLRKSG